VLQLLCIQRRTVANFSRFGQNNRCETESSMVCLLLEPLLSGSSCGKMPTIEELEQDTASLEYESEF
jgi:hypothetical protein